MKCPTCNTDNPTDSKYCKECATPFPSQQEINVSQTRTIRKPLLELSVGETFARKYKIVEEIGRGGMGVVYKAEDTKLKRTVALKFLPSELTIEPEARERLIREAQAAAALDHPNICTIYEVDEAAGKTFISMAYVEGLSLRERIEQGPLKPNEVLDIAIQVAEGLEEAHKKGIIHRDIKSSNIMVTGKSQLRIMDFGLAKVRGGPRVTKEGTTLGTVAYMSPEQARAEDVDHRTDIWSLGVVIYEMLSGQLPFQGDSDASFLYSIVHSEPKSLRERNPDIPPELEKIVTHALKKKPDSRFSSVAEMMRELKKYQTGLIRAADHGVTDFRTFWRCIRKPFIAVPTILSILVLCFLVILLVNRRAKINWAEDQAIPEIYELAENENFIPAFQLALKAERYVPKNPLLSNIWPEISKQVSIQSDPPGAVVYFKEYKAVDSRWEYLGQTPIVMTRVPIGFFRWKAEKEACENVEGSAWSSVGLMNLILDKKGSIPSEMVRVPGGVAGFAPIPGLSNVKSVKLEHFLIDRYEVTNRQFKEFVESGGYQKPEFWKHEFIKKKKVLWWKDAMAEFQDATGKPGPANWELGTYPEGQEDYPVSGVSWYEAAAYAEFAGKSLPTIYHWFRAAGVNDSSDILPLSNFGSSGPAPVKSHQGLSIYGTYDMAGNVREWCLNPTGKNRFILGGAWSEQSYMFSSANTIEPFDRSLTNGFRCMKNLTPESTPEEAKQPVPTPSLRDYTKETPVSDEIFRVYTRLYAFDRSDLAPEIEFADESPKYWVKEKISYNTAYGNERMFAYLFLPKTASPPYQTLVIFPGASAFNLKSSDNGDRLHSWYPLDLIIKSGRALLYPIYKSSFERGDGYSAFDPNISMNTHREHIFEWWKDLEMSLDYLETRTDIDYEKLCYYGSSWGSLMGSIFLAMEKRFQVCILLLGGLPSWELPSEIDSINFVPRIKIPVLMINGMYDYFFPHERSQISLYNLLGTPEEHKRHVVFDTDHSIYGYKNEIVREVLGWLDRYLGPVK